MGQKLRGLVGQSMNGQRKALTPIVKSYVPGSYTLVITKSGWYKFVLDSGGGGANNGVSSGGSGAKLIATRSLSASQRVTIAVGIAGATGGGSGGNTTVTLPSGEVLTATGAAGVTAGTATANLALGDVAVQGTNGTLGAGTNLDGATGPTSGDFLGGVAGPGASNVPGGSPGAGGGTNGTSGNYGGHGQLLVMQVKMRPA